MIDQKIIEDVISLLYSHADSK